MTHEKLQEARRLADCIEDFEWYLESVRHHDLRIDFTPIGMDKTRANPRNYGNMVSFTGAESEARFIREPEHYLLDREATKALQLAAIEIIEAHLAKLKQRFADV
ncbi:MAG: hypothetical protein ACK4Q5_06070 [Saprospiraceae bacterium]